MVSTGNPSANAPASDRGQARKARETGDSIAVNWIAASSAEVDLLRRACRAYLLHRTVTSVEIRDRQAIDWRLFATSARANRLWWATAGIVSPGIAPDWLVRDARAAREKAMLSNARVLATARRIVPTLLSAGLHPVVIKGPLQQRRLFATPFLRTSTDLDILVPTGETGDAVRVLTDNGYRLPPECDSPWWRMFLGEQHLVADDTAMCEIDLHHRVQQPGILGPRDMDAFVAQAEQVPLGSAVLPVLSPASAWLLSCLSLVKAIMHREPGGAYAMEVAAAAMAAEPDAIAAFEAAATRQGMERTALFSIGAVEHLFGIDLPVFAGRPRTKIVPRAILCDVLFGLEPRDAALPRRHRMLWHLCDRRKPGRLGTYAGELAWSAGAELCRRTYHRRGRTRRSARQGITKDRDVTRPAPYPN